MWRYKWHIVAAAVLAAAVAFGLSMLRETLYRAEGTVLLNDPRSSGGIANEIGLVLDPRRYVRNQAKIVESRQVAERAADDLGTGVTAMEIQEATTATPASDLDAITVSGTMPTAASAVALVDAVVGAYEQIITGQVQASAEASIATLEASKADAEAKISELDALIAANPGDSSLEAQRTAAINQLVAIDTRIELLATNAALYGSGVQLYLSPDTPLNPVQPLPLRNAAIAFLAGALGAGTWAWWRADRNQIATDHNSPAEVLGSPLLATVPDYKNVTDDLPTVTAPASAATEAYQFAVSSLGFALEKAGGRTVLITSASPGDGKTATALNLAIAATHDGRTPLLVDADERAQGLTQLSGLEGEFGISDFNGSESADRSTHRWSMADGTVLDFIPAGTGITGNTAAFFRSDGFRSAIKELLATRDMVIIDSPPVMAAAETTDVAAAADAVVLVVSEGTPLRDLEDAKRRLAMSDTPIIGYVFNRATTRSGMHRYGYGYGANAKE